MTEDPRFVIWSIDHAMWWAPNEWGYTRVLGEAGRYSQRHAEEIRTRANLVGVHEVVIPIETIDATPALLTSCKELRDALAAAIRVIADSASEQYASPEIFVAEMTRLGIAPGVGFRADEAIAAAEGKPRRTRDPEVTLEIE